MTNIELALGEQALDRLWRIERPTLNVELGPVAVLPMAELPSSLMLRRDKWPRLSMRKME